MVLRPRSCPLLTLFDRVVAVAVGVVGHVSQQGVMGMRVFGAQAVCVCSRVCAASAREFTWKVKEKTVVQLQLLMLAVVAFLQSNPETYLYLIFILITYLYI